VPDDATDLLTPTKILEYAQSIVAWLTMHACSPPDGSAVLSVALGIWIEGMTAVVARDNQAECRADCVANAAACIVRIAEITHAARAAREAATGDDRDTRH
jgi:hypothetical protein